MASPFNIFRQNQKILMVVLVGLAMVSFIAFGDTMDASSVLPVLAALLGGLALYLLAGKGGTEGLAIAAVGGVLGLAIGLVGPRFLNSNSVASTTAGSVSNADLQSLADDRGKADSLVAAAMISGGVEPGRIPNTFFGFTDPDAPGDVRQGLMVRYLMGQEADRLGIQVSDDAIREFLTEVSKGKFSEDEFRKLRGRLRVGADDLIDALRGELRAQQAFLILMPKIGSPQPSVNSQQEWFLQMLASAPAGVTPLRLWEDFAKLHEEARVTAVAVPADAFVAQVADPSADAANAFFNEFKAAPPIAGRPGFLVPEKVQLAYFAVGPDAVRKSLPPATDEEVRDYYEQHKDNYRLIGLDDPASGPAVPGIGDTPAAPVEAPRPAAEPSGEAKPGGDATSGLAADESFVLFQATPAEAPKPPREPAAEPAAESPPGPSFPAPSFPPPDASAPPMGEAAPRYRELDDELKARIRETLLRQRTAAALDAVTQTALDAVFRIADEESAAILPPEDRDDAKAAKAFEAQRLSAVKSAVAKMEAYAKSKGYPFTATEMISAEELQSGEDYPIGLAVRWTPGQSPFQRGAVTVPELVFGTNQLLVAEAAEQPATSIRYVFVKTADEPEHVPTLEEEGVRTAVVTAWRKAQARKLADDRAKELADAARKAKTDLGAFLAARRPTVTGKKGSQELTAREVGPFSWYRDQSAPSQGFHFPEITVGSVPQLQPVGDDFMRTVFETLKPGEIGSALSADGDVAYVVELKSKTPDKPEGFDSLRQEFLGQKFDYINPRGNQLGMAMRQEAIQAWVRHLKQRYAVQWKAPSAAPPAAM